MTLNEYCGWVGDDGRPLPTTDRQARLADAVDAAEYDEPSRADYYAMRICQTVTLVNAKKGTEVDLNNFKLSFRSGNEARKYSIRPGLPQPLTKEQVVELRRKQDLAKASRANSRTNRLPPRTGR